MTVLVRVPDTSSLIRIKQIVRIDRQWELFQQLQASVDAGEIAMSRQVINEIGDVAHPDAPGVWARGMRDRLIHPLDVDEGYVQRVMRETRRLVEANEQKDVADPYVLALALQLEAEGKTVEVVTDDLVDHLPRKIALATACNHFNVAHVSCEEFLTAIGF